MLNWNATATSNTFCAKTECFKYIIEPIPVSEPLKFQCSLQVCAGVAIKIGKPLTLEAAKARAQLDYAARIAQGERVKEAGIYQE